ncbi:toprim domain-containing protein [Desulfotalea psychrophila]|nr:toprim domain-containing protein [Desulfotalea psychrophila]
MNTESIVRKIAAEHGLRKKGNRFTGPCPECGGSKTSDKFSILLDGGFKCYACNFRGDIITWLRKRESMNCPDAHDYAGRDCRQKDSCPAAAHCRLGNGSAPATKRRPAYRRPSRPRQEEEVQQTLPMVEPQYPKAVWVSWADALVQKAHEKLLETPEQLAYLASRGIDAEAVDRFSLGWLSHQQQVLKNKIGLPVDEGKDKLWVPEGLLIPIFDQSGSLHRIRIRRSPEARAKFLPNLKYNWMRGAGNMPMALVPEGKIRGAVIVEAELDAMAVASAHVDVAAIAVGSLGSGVDPELDQLLEQAPVVLVALDAEDKAEKVADMWKEKYRHAKYYKTTIGKDPGEMFAAGGDLHAWIERGLPLQPSRPRSTPAPVPKQDEAFLPARKLNRGGGGAQIIEPSAKASIDSDVACPQPEKIKGPVVPSNSKSFSMTLPNGTVIYVVPSKDKEWQELTDQGLPVFTAYEIDKLGAAVSTMNDEERLKAATAAINIKTVFGGYISRGEAIEAGEDGGDPCTQDGPEKPQSAVRL